jgi:hypothetical protein
MLAPMSDENDVPALLRKVHGELEKTNALLTRFGLPIFALLVILVVLEIVHR